LLPPPAPALGKNRVPTTRFAHILLTKWASPNRLLAANFPNNAARKKPRIVAAILGESAKGLWLGVPPALRTTPPASSREPQASLQADRLGHLSPDAGKLVCRDPGLGRPYSRCRCASDKWRQRKTSLRATVLGARVDRFR
jgi:hypothetical protein